MIFIDEFAPQLGNRLFPTWKTDSAFGFIPTVTEEKVQAVYREPHFKYAPIPYHRNMQISGYFQSQKYFIESEKSIRKLFTIVPEFKQSVANSLQSFLHFGYVNCSIHVRRGDYATLPLHHPMLDMGYFSKAIDIIKSHEKYVNFYVFSDDIEWCRANFPNTENFTFMEGTVIGDFSAMSSCDHHIISNSSYSWWAAWLNPNRSKRVIAPKRWFGTALAHHDISDLLPPEWMTI
jgi:hypothetical protein